MSLHFCMPGQSSAKLELGCCLLLAACCRFCDNWGPRCEAAARTWTRPHAQDNLMCVILSAATCCLACITCTHLCCLLACVLSAAQGRPCMCDVSHRGTTLAACIPPCCGTACPHVAAAQPTAPSAQVIIPEGCVVMVDTRKEARLPALAPMSQGPGASGPCAWLVQLQPGGQARAEPGCGGQGV